jgi:hypothetical protein
MLDGLFVIESWRMDSAELEVRLVPDHFGPSFSEPVVVVLVSEPESPQVLEVALARRKGELIVDLQVTENEAAIYAEFDEEPASLRGSVVSVTRSAYSVADLQRIIGHQEEELCRSSEIMRAYRATIDGMQVLVAESIRRAEIKRESTSRDPERYNHEIDGLRRILQWVQQR